MESHASAARPASTTTVGGLWATARRLAGGLELPVCAAVALPLAFAAFVAEGGLELGSSTLVETVTIAIAAVVVAASLVWVGFEARLHGGLALTALAGLAGLTGLSILWSLHPSDTWVETNRTFAYVAVFAAGIAAVRLVRGRWRGVLAGVLLALVVVSLYGLMSKVVPGWLAEHETYGRLREPFGYWNAVGVTAAMAIPLTLWFGTREAGHRLSNALAWPLLTLLIITMLLSFSRGSILAAVAGIAVWLALVPLRLRTLALLAPAALAAAAVTAWAFGQSALTDDRILLDARKDAGVELGLILLAVALLLYAAGVVIQSQAERRPLAEETRRRIGTVALAVLVVSPIVGIGALAFTDRGVTGTISDRWSDLTKAEAVTPENQPGRLTETASVRSIYWRRAIDVWERHRVAGAGAGSFAEAQLRFRREPAQGKHAHGYVLQTLADLGLLGLAVSLVALGAWLVSTRESLAVRRGALTGRAAEWPPERFGLVALAAVAVVFGVHSALDWTWFVPGVAMAGLFAAGWVAGRGPLAGSAARVPPLAAVRAALPPRHVLRRRGALAAGVALFSAIAIVAVTQPWRAREKGDDALRLSAAGQFGGARTAVDDAADVDPLSIEPYFELAAIEDAQGRRQAALAALEQAVQLEPASPEAWRRLGDYYLHPLAQPDQAIEVLRGALFLDPLNGGTRSMFLTALRARDVLRRAEAARLAEARRLKAAKRRASKARRTAKARRDRAASR